MNQLSQGKPFRKSSSVVVLSPHCDDAAFSLGGLLKHCHDLGKPTTVITCFSSSSYAPRVILKTTQRVSRIRKREDEAFAATLNGKCRMVWLDLPEAPLRPDYHQLDVCTSRPMTAGDLAIAAELSKKFVEHLKTDALVLIPLGLGFHIDHRIVREAGLSLAAEGFSSLFFYEELPYAAAHSLPTLEAWENSVALSRKLRLDPSHVSFPGLAEVKKKAILCYPSQAPDYVLKRILEHARRRDPLGQGAECVWQMAYSQTRKDPVTSMWQEHEAESSPVEMQP